MPYFQTLPDFEKNKKAVQTFNVFLKILLYRGFFAQNIKKFEISLLTPDSR